MMNGEEFRAAGHAAIERIIAYNQDLAAIRPSDAETETSVVSQVTPGYLRSRISSTIPNHGVQFTEIQRDIEESIFPGITHWQSPNFMAYFPANSSYPGILGDMYADMFTCAAFNWQASPAVTELETIVMDMLADALGLDKSYKSDGEGGGVIFGTASEAALTMMITARDRLLDSEDGVNVPLDSLVIIISDQTHSGVEKAAKLLRIKCHKIKTVSQDGYAITGARLCTALSELRGRGLHPFFLCLTLGTTAICAIDHFESITLILEEPENQMIWTHLDAAYAGAALVCPEFQHHLRYSEKYDSFEMNAHKWLLTNFDCSCLWLRTRKHLINAMDITPAYLRNPASDAGPCHRLQELGYSTGTKIQGTKTVVRLQDVRSIRYAGTHPKAR